MGVKLWNCEIVKLAFKKFLKGGRVVVLAQGVKTIISQAYIFFTETSCSDHREGSG